VLYIQEDSVCWYDGLSCKLINYLVVKGSIPFLPIGFYSSMVELDTVNIEIDVQFILEAIFT
jgi:hypothetical protein